MAGRKEVPDGDVYVILSVLHSLGVRKIWTQRGVYIRI